MRGIERIGPLVVAQPTPTSGFVTHAPLAADDVAGFADLVAAVRDWCAAGELTEVEWKTRGHDEGFAAPVGDSAAPSPPSRLTRLLCEHGYVADEVETVVAGDARTLCGPIVLDGAAVQRAGDHGRLHDEVVRAVALQDQVFGRSLPGMVDRLVERIEAGSTQLWYAEANGEVVGAARVDPVPGTDFAGLWGGSVRADWRGRGVYRALTRARASAALATGATLLHADCTELSRPILERCGLVAVTTTTPYVWRRP